MTKPLPRPNSHENRDDPANDQHPAAVGSTGGCSSLAEIEYPLDTGRNDYLVLAGTPMVSRSMLGRLPACSTSGGDHRRQAADTRRSSRNHPTAPSNSPLAPGLRQGPKFGTLGRRVIYREADVVARIERQFHSEQHKASPDLPPSGLGIRLRRSCWHPTRDRRPERASREGNPLGASRGNRRWL